MANDSTSGQVAGAAVTALGNYAVQAASNKRQFKFQKEAMALQDQYNRNIWDYQNAYNTPTAQMERLKEAGLNPRLIYGSGSGAANTAGPINGLEVPERKSATADVPDLMLRHLQTRQADAQYAATLQTMENMRTKNDLVNVQTGLENLKLMRENMRAKNYKVLNQAEKDMAEWAARTSGQIYANEKSKGTLLDQSYSIREAERDPKLRQLKLDNEFKENRNELAKHGIYQSDHPFFRLLIQHAKHMGIDLGELLKMGPLDHLKNLIGN